MTKTSFIKTRFINLTRDFGFKLCFANPEHPELLLGLLNSLITDREIVSITFLNPDVMAPDEDGKRPSYDVQCTDSDGNRFIVEMQKDPYREFGDRLLLYSGNPLQYLLKRGEPYERMRTLYVIAVLGGYLKVPDEEKPVRDALVRSAHIQMNDTKKILTYKHNLLFLQLPAVKRVTEDSPFLERWAWYVSNIHTFEEKPEGLDGYFSLLFDCADRNNISRAALSVYDDMERDEQTIECEKRDIRIDAREEALEEGLAEGLAKGEAKGRAEGRAEGINAGRSEATFEMAKKMKADGLSVEAICKYTGLSSEQVEGLA